jgi:hypothetical protein
MKLTTIDLKIDVNYGRYVYNFCEPVDWCRRGLIIEVDIYREKIKVKTPANGTVLLNYRSIPKGKKKNEDFKLWVSSGALVHFNEKACFLKFSSFIGDDWVGYSRFIRLQPYSEELAIELGLISAFTCGDIVPYTNNLNDWRGKTRIPRNYLDFHLEDLEYVKLFNIEREKNLLSKKVRTVATSKVKNQRFKL